MTRARIIGVTGAGGGVGTSTFVAALAVRAACSGHRVACIDLRPYGGGLDLVLGADHERGLRWPDLAHATADLDGAALLAELPSVSGVPVVSFDRAGPPELDTEALDAVVGAVVGHVDLILLDLDQHGSPLGRRACAHLDDGVLLAGATPISLAAANAICADLDDSVPRWWLAQRACGGRDDLAEAVSEALGLPVLATLPTDDRLHADLLRGRPPSGRGAYARAADAALSLLLGQERRAA